MRLAYSPLEGKKMPWKFRDHGEIADIFFIDNLEGQVILIFPNKKFESTILNSRPRDS